MPYRKTQLSFKTVVEFFDVTEVTGVALFRFFLGLARQICANCQIVSLEGDPGCSLSERRPVRRLETDLDPLMTVFRTLPWTKPVLFHLVVRISGHIMPVIHASQCIVMSSITQMTSEYCKEHQARYVCTYWWWIRSVVVHHLFRHTSERLCSYSVGRRIPACLQCWLFPDSKVNCLSLKELHCPEWPFISSFVRQ